MAVKLRLKCKEPFKIKHNKLKIVLRSLIRTYQESSYLVIIKTNNQQKTQDYI